MKIYITHSKDIEYAEKLYKPIRESGLSKEHEFTLPYEHGTPEYSSKEKIHDSHLIIAEVSKQSTGSGIEIGWANMYEKPIVALYRDGTVPSKSIRFAVKEMLEYKDEEDFIVKIAEAIKKYA